MKAEQQGSIVMMTNQTIVVAGRLRKPRLKAAIPFFLLALAATACAQSRELAAHAVILSRADAGSTDSTRAGVVREIDDPHLGMRWLLLRSLDHPGGPGRLVVASVSGSASPIQQSAGPITEVGAGPLPPVIRAGERLIVEENSPLVEARLEAVALGSAAVGSTLEIRLRIGGVVMGATALGPGRAVLRRENGVQP
jgi:hypothetical protein